MSVLLSTPRAAKEAAGPEGGPLPLLLACHVRIRSFSALSLKLLEAGGAPAEQVRGAATSVLRYFTEALPRHSDDEELSLAPRLVGWVRGAALAEMAEQHLQMEALVDELAGMWLTLAEAPEELAALEGPLRAPTVRAQIWTEMRARRGLAP